MRTVPFGRGQLIGAPDLVYQVLAAPLHRNIFTNIVSFLTDSAGEHTIDTYRLSFACAFLRRWTSSYNQVDTPSVAESAAPSPMGSSNASVPPADGAYWGVGLDF